MKRKNRLTINFLHPGNYEKGRKFKICKETINLQQPLLDSVNDVSDAPEADMEFESQDIEESSDLETAHTKQKLKLANS